MFRRNIQFESYYPPEAAAGDISKPALTKDGILDELMKDDDKDEVIPLEDKEDKKDDKSEKKESKDDKEENEETEEENDEESEEKDDLEELEDELEEPDEEKLELTTPASRREILKKYPKLFKDFPQLEKSYYREQEFTKILPTIADAKEAAEARETLSNLDKDLSNGNTELILKAIKDNNPKAFNKIVDDYLVTLSKVDKDAYTHVLGNTIKYTIQAMIEESRSTSNEVLEQAATILNQFVFGNSKFTPPSKLSKDEKPESDDKEKQISEREKAFTRKKFNDANDELSVKVSKTYKATIEANIDPKGSMTDYVKKTATREALEELESLIKKDTRFTTLIDKLWERAFKNDFDADSIKKIRSAFVSKAQTLLPAVIKKARNEALKGMNLRVRADKDDDSHPDKESKTDKDSRPRRESNRGDESHRRNDSGKKEVPAGMSSLEYLMSED